MYNKKRLRTSFIIVMEKKNIFTKINELLNQKWKRGLLVFLFTLPFLVVIGIFGYRVYKEAMTLINLTTGTTEVKEENKIDNVSYILRENATDYQKELFIEMKDAFESGVADNKTLSELICKNFVADFYTWTNKQGQFDVGGMYYVYDGEYEDGTHAKQNIYQNARQNFYKYLSNYIKEYGAKDLLEVENIEVVSSNKTDDFVINEHVKNVQGEDGNWYDYREDHPYEAYAVTLSWNYKQTAKFDTTPFTTKCNFIVINSDGNFCIVAADTGAIDTSIPEKVETEENETEVDTETSSEEVTDDEVE